MKQILRKWRDIVTVINGKNQRKVVNSKGRYPIYGSGGIIGYANDFLCEAGTTIVGRKGTINSPIFVNERFWNVDTAFGICPGKELNPKYLYYFCQAFNFKMLDKSTTIPSLAKRDLLNIEMPVLPLDEQKYIVAQIEKIFSKIDAGVENLQKITRQIAAYRQAVLKEAFENIERKQAIQELSQVVTSGSRGWAKYYANEGARFIRITDLTRDRISLKNDNIQYVAVPKNAEGRRSQLKKNDVLVSITADLGSIALVPENIGEAYINQHIAVIRFTNPAMGGFMAWYLKSDYGQKDLLKNKRGGGKLGLGLDDIRNTFVPVVSDEFAEKAEQEINGKMLVCDNVERTIENALRHAGSMRQSILKNAFEGRFQV